ncbi:MAG: hypothetical protein ABIR96_06595 [Bdellovibrionota bacterium]
MSKLLVSLPCAAIFFSGATLFAADTKIDLRQRASEELQSSTVKNPSKNKASEKIAAAPLSTDAAPTATKASAAPAQPYMQTVLPEDLRDEHRAQWTLEVGVENQKPRGQIEMTTLSPLDLETFDTKPALGVTLGWWLGDALRPVLGSRVRTGIAAQLGWSQHRYSLNLPGRLTPTEAHLEVLRPQLAALVEYLVAVPAGWNTEFWLGAEGAQGRLMQSQTSADSDLLNVSLNKNYFEFGTQLRSVISKNFLVNVQYRQRVYAGQEGKSHHAIIAFGMAL